MQTLNPSRESPALPKVPTAASPADFGKCTCDYCGEVIKFMSGAQGQTAECPNCGRGVVLSSIQIKPTMAQPGLVGERLRITNRSKIRQVAARVGLGLFPISVISLLWLVLTPYEIAKPPVRGLILLLDLLFATAGLVMLIEGKRTKTRWTCSICHSRLDSWNTISCRCCGAGLR